MKASKKKGSLPSKDMPHKQSGMPKEMGPKTKAEKPMQSECEKRRKDILKK